MKQFLLLTVLVFSSSSAFSTQYLVLDGQDLHVRNSRGEDVVVTRTALSPAKVKIRMNPVVEYKEECLQKEQRRECGYNSSYCGYDTRYDCAGGRPCPPMQEPRFCCYVAEFCLRYGQMPHEKYLAAFTLDFQRSKAVPAGKSDTISLKPSDDGKDLEVKTLSSQNPYTIKRGGVFSRSTFFFSQDN